MANEEKTQAEVIIEQFRAAGVEIKEMDLAPGTHIITFSGTGFAWPKKAPEEQSAEE